MRQWKNLSHLLSAEMDAISARTRLLQGMTDAAQRVLPGNLARHCSVDGYDGNQLLVLADDSSCATLVYFHQRKILDALNKKFSKSLGCRFSKIRLLVCRGN